MTIENCLKLATEKLTTAGVAQPSREAASLLIHAVGRDRTFLVAHPEYELTTAEQQTFDSHIERRQSREPFQHITGFQEFYGLSFFVSPDVLIPRPETELLVETAIDLLSKIEKPKFCEIGVGSGCISVSILHELPSTNAIALDISQKALDIARINAVNNCVDDRIELLLSDVFDNVGANKFDAVFSNPPYIPVADFARLQPEVREFDPRIALTDGEDGLSIIRRIVYSAPQYLNSGSYLLLEIGIGQADNVRKMFRNDVWESVEIMSDLQGIPRTVKARTK